MRNRASGLKGGISWLVMLVGATLLTDATLVSTAWAQAGFYVTPSVSVSESYDDNVLSVPNNRAQPTPVPTVSPPSDQTSPAPIVDRRNEKIDDFVLSGSAGLEGGYQSAPFTLLAGYRFGAEAYADNSDLNSAPARQSLTVRGNYLVDPLLTLELNGGYLESHFARELNAPAVSAETGQPVTALESSRARAVSYYANPALSYAFDPVTTATAGYRFEHLSQVGSASSETNGANAGLARKISELDTVDLNYAYRRFSFDQVPTAFAAAAEPTPVEPTPAPEPTPSVRTRSSNEDSHAVTLGWGRPLTELTRILLRGGPRFSQGSVNAEAEASINRKLERGDVGFSYVRTQTTSVGLEGALDTESFTGTLSYEPRQDLTTIAALGLYRSSRKGESADVYSANLTARYRLLEWLSLFGGYQFSLQKGVFESAEDSPRRNEKIYHNIVTVGLEASQPFRAY